MRPDVDSALLALVGDMLAVVPTRRPLSMSEVEVRLKAIASPTDLSDLVAEYYRWRSRSNRAMAARTAKADTEPGTAPSTANQSTPAVSSSVKPPAASPQLPPRALASFMQNWQTLALVGCVAVMGPMAVALWRSANQDSQPTAQPSNSQGSVQGSKGVPETPPSPPVLSNVQISPENDFASQLLELGIVRIEKIGTGQVYELSTGNIELPPGKYILRYYQSSIKFQADGSEIEIASASTQTLRIEAQLAENFQYPVLASVGAFATYYGEIWLATWGDRPGLSKKMHYRLDLEVLAEENKPDSPLSRWLKVEITDSDNVYSETAYIKVDVKDWENGKQLKIHEGYIVANRGLASKEGSLKEGGLVVPFDLKHDLLAEKGMDLPKRRLSAQDAIALFFAVEDQIDIAAAPIRMARSQLSAKKRNELLGPVKSTKGTETGYNASSWTKDQVDRVQGYRIARGASDVSNPWGIFEIQVDSPVLYATCTIKSAGAKNLMYSL